jgi:phage shock protein PspC (stress-responsive transcriptional regulator)
VDFFNGQIINFTVMKNDLRRMIEMQAFGVCTAIGERIGIATSRIRMWFIYISFLTFGSPVIIYMILAFWINMKNYIYSARRNPLRNL